jgi:hypothetical protein
MPLRQIPPQQSTSNSQVVSSATQLPHWQNCPDGQQTSPQINRGSQHAPPAQISPSAQHVSIPLTAVQISSGEQQDQASSVVTKGSWQAPPQQTWSPWQERQHVPQWSALSASSAGVQQIPSQQVSPGAQALPRSPQFCSSRW